MAELFLSTPSKINTPHLRGLYLVNQDAGWWEEKIFIFWCGIQFFRSQCQTPGSLCNWTWGHWFFGVFIPHFYRTKGRSPSTMSEPSRNKMRSKRGGSRSSSQPRSLIPSTPKGVLGTIDPELLGTLACCGFWGWTGCGVWRVGWLLTVCWGWRWWISWTKIRPWQLMVCLPPPAEWL